MRTSLYGVTEKAKENAKRRCAELNREVIAVGKNGEHYVVVARKLVNKYADCGMGWFDVWTNCDEEGNFNYGSYDLSEETAMEIFYCGNSYYRAEVVDRKYPCNYERLVELATKLKDGLLEDDYEEGLEYLKETCEFTTEEAEFFGVDFRDLEEEK